MFNQRTTMTPFDTANQGYQYLADIIAQHNLCTACMKIVGGQDALVESIRAILKMRRKFEPERIRQITPSLVKSLISQAKRSEHNEFTLLSRNTLVALCGGLESLVKDVVAAEFLENPEWVDKFNDRSLRFRASDLLVHDDLERARLLVDALYQAEGAKSGQTERLKVTAHVSLH
jgi:hypothetical protein